jgi:hypothetical protein
VKLVFKNQDAVETANTVFESIGGLHHIWECTVPPLFGLSTYSIQTLLQNIMLCDFRSSVGRRVLTIDNLC